VGDASVRAVIEIDWSDVQPRIEILEGFAGSAKVFGATSHGWQLEPPLTTQEVVDLESQIGARLPAEYRSFLLQVSRGGAGPAYGLFPVRRVDGRWKWEGDGASLNDSGALGQPFGHIRAFNPADDLPPQPEIGHDEEAWWELHDKLLYDPAHSAGLLYLCHLGCALREALVVSGPSRGQMWADDTADEAGFHPLRNPDGSRMTFADWYRTWLAKSEQAAAGT
jgi:SMI1/KNR4 family protein SUKH-1